jgi:hypothetical protein
MPTAIRRLWAAGGLLLAALAASAGCSQGGHFTLLGYTTQPTYDPGIRTVYVPIAQNISYRRGLEFQLTHAVIRDLESKTPFKVVSCRADADTELNLKIINRRKLVLLTSQTGEVRDADISLFVEVVWRDLRPGKVGDILSNPKRFDPNEQPLPGMLPEKAPNAIPVLITPIGSYVAELGGSVTTAEKQAIDRAATQIISMMEPGW